MKREPIIIVLKIVISYLVIAGSYILISDYYVASMSNDQNVITRLQTYKGWGFVLVSSIGLFLVLYKLFRNLNKEKEIQLEAQSLLQKSEQMFRLLFLNSGEAILLTNLDGSIDAANPAACKIFGRSEKEICSVGRNGIIDLKDPKLILALEERKQTGKFIGELNFVRKDGSVFPGEISSSIFYDADGKEKTSMIIRDISERRLAEKELISKNSLLTAIYESSPFMMVLVDKSGKVISINQAGIKFSNHEKNEIIGLLGGEVFNCLNSFKAPGCGRNEECSTCPIRTRVTQTFTTGELILNGEGEMTFLMNGQEIRLTLSISTTLIKRSEGDMVLVFIEDISERKSTELALLKSRKEFQSYFDSNSIGLSVTDSDKTWIEVNQRLCSMLGYTKDELTGHNWIEFTHPDDIDKNSVLFNSALIGEIEKYDLEKRFLRKDGSIIFIFISAVCLRNMDGSLDHLLTSYNDITERKLAEEALLNSQTRLRTLIQTIPDLIWLKDKEGVYLLCNKTFELFFGASEEEIIGKTDYDFIDSKQADYFRLNDNKAMASGKANINEELITFASDEHNAFLETIKTPVLNSNGELIGVLGIGRDITSRKLAEIALIESEERFHTMFEDHSAVMLLIDPLTENIIDANHSAVNFYGYPLDQLEKMKISDINVMPKNEIKEAINRATEESKTYFNFPHKLSNGEIRLVEIFTSPVELKTGRFLFSIIHDITKRKQAETEVLETKDKLRALAARLERVKEEERISLSRELHDHLGQNLTGLKMDTAYIAKKIKFGIQMESEDLLSKTNSMIELIDELIRNVRKISSDLRPNVLDYLGLIPAIEWQMDECKSRSEIGCEFKSNIDKIDLGIEKNSSIFRIVQEAFTNIIRHSKATFVSVSINEENDFIKLEILDNGIGINAENLTKSSSLGILGMRERTLQFNGKLHLENAEQGGTLITLIIPKNI